MLNRAISVIVSCHGNSDYILEQAIKKIRDHTDRKTKIYLFGSQAKKRAHSHSDLDIALLGEKPILPCLWLLYPK